MHTDIYTRVQIGPYICMSCSVFFLRVSGYSRSGNPNPLQTGFQVSHIYSSCLWISFLQKHCTFTSGCEVWAIFHRLFNLTILPVQILFQFDSDLHNILFSSHNIPILLICSSPVLLFLDTGFIFFVLNIRSVIHTQRLLFPMHVLFGLRIWGCMIW